MTRETSPRRAPTQARSRERIQRILQAASDLIQRDGADAFTVQAVADAAEVPIGSVYQYFPGKPGIIRALAENHLNALREKLRNDLSDFQRGKPTRRQISAAIEQIVDTYYEYYSSDPTFRLIWGGVQADPVLRELDVRDTEQNARIFQTALRPYFPHLPASEIYGLCLLICDTTASALRLALDYEEHPKKKKGGTHRAIIRELKTMLSAYMRAKFTRNQAR
ncbi:MAG: TetR/AcrR family transcriptional regulator [bacterium]|nr:TetR/AcrR family transcriptional regulator [bacterium]